VVTLQDPWEDETRVDPVAGAGRSAKNVSEILGQSRSRPYWLFRVGLPNIKLAVVSNRFDLQAAGSCRAMYG
jgi:hypothetical protein